MEYYPLIKALHLIGIVCWFAGLFYLVRLYIYHVEANDRPADERKVLQDQLIIMARRLLKGITTPAMIITTFCGMWLLGLGKQTGMHWFHIKALFLVGLFIYHFHCAGIYKKLLNGKPTMNSRQLRMYNELSTFFLFTIVFAAVLKDPHWIGKAIAFFCVAFVALFVIVRKLMARKKS